MYKSLLTKKFFQDNPIVEFSTQRFVYGILTYVGIEEYTDKIIIKHAGYNDECLDRLMREKEQIQAEQNLDDLFQFLREKIEVSNRIDLVKKVLEYEDALMPRVVDKLIRSDHDIFIENATRLLARSKKDYSQQLFTRYTEIRSPYVRSLVCLIFSLRMGEEIIPWMMNQFHEIKKLYPDETFDQGPLLALHELKHRFYQK